MSSIKILRERNNLTQENLAKRLSVSQQSVAKWESGEVMPRAEKLPQLAAALECTIDELLKDGESAAQENPAV